MLKDLFHNVSFLFRTFHESTSLVFVLESDLSIYDTNVSVANQLGFGHAYIRSKFFSDLVWEEERASTTKLLENSIKERNNVTGEFYIIDKKDEIHLINFKGFPYENEENKKLYYILIGDDITKIKMLEQSEMVEYQKFQSLFNSPGIGIALIDLNSIFLDANKTFTQLVGYSRRELLKMFIDDLLLNSDTFQFDGIKTRLNNGKKYDQFEIQYRKKDGFIIWVSVNVILHSVDNKPLYYVATFHDVTDKKFYEQKAIENERKYRMLFDRSFNAIAYKKLIYDRKGKIQDYLIMDANETFERVTGLNKNEIIGRPMRIKAQEHFKVSSRENLSRLKHYDRILKDGKDVHFKSQPSRTFNRPIDVYYYIVDRKEDLIAVVFGDVEDGRIVMNL